MNLTSTALGDLARTQPAATRVFLRHRLDFCCKGRRTLAEACGEAGLDATVIESELLAEAARPTDEKEWETRSQRELADHIVTRYHVALRRDFPPLIEAARKVERVHATKPAVPAGLADELEAFFGELVPHMQKEEQVLFPMLSSGAHGPQVFPPVRMMELEHTHHARHLARVRELTGELEAPPHACATWRALYAGLREAEAELMLHIHLENNVLFRRATVDGSRTSATGV